MVTLHPGDVALSVRGDRLETLLGSCVAIVLTDPRRTVGAMCHFVYTRTSTHAAATSAAQADQALKAMAQLLQTHGIRVVSADVGGAVYRRLRWTVGPQAPQIETVPL